MDDVEQEELRAGIERKPGEAHERAADPRAWFSRRGESYDLTSIAGHRDANRYVPSIVPCAVPFGARDARKKDFAYAFTYRKSMEDMRQPVVEGVDRLYTPTGALKSPSEAPGT